MTLSGERLAVSLGRASPRPLAIVVGHRVREPAAVLADDGDRLAAVGGSDASQGAIGERDLIGGLPCGGECELPIVEHLLGAVDSEDRPIRAADGGDGVVTCAHRHPCACLTPMAICYASMRCVQRGVPLLDRYRTRSGVP